MIAQPQNPWPLKEEDCACLDGILRDIATMQEALRNCQDCGLPMQDQADQLEARRQLVANLKAKFFPGRP